MSSNGSGKKLEGFFTDKGFYIVLFLCAAVIGVSAWMMAAGNKTMAKDQKNSNGVSLNNPRVETVIIPPVTEEDELVDAVAPEVDTEGLAEIENAVGSVSEETVEAAAPLYVWPVTGELERGYCCDELAYDVTLRDWRAHEGIDILAPLGSTVVNAHAGLVESIEVDDLYGTVVTISHGDGGRTIYANLADTPAVNVGDWIEPGTVLGAIGTTALCEVGQATHLHFAITVDGESVNPLLYLPV